MRKTKFFPKVKFIFVPLCIVLLIVYFCQSIFNPRHLLSDVSKESPKNFNKTIESPKSFIKTKDALKIFIETTESAQNFIETTESPKNFTRTTESPQNFIKTTESPQNFIKTTESAQNFIETTESPKHLIYNKESSKYFIYTCEQFDLCGGLADRQEGMVAAYIISQMLKRTFKMRMLRPCDIAIHLDGERFNWILNSELAGRKNILRYKRLDQSAWELRKRIANGLDLEKEFPSDLTYFNVNQEMVNYLMKHPLYSTLEWARNKTTPEVYNIVLRALFKMKPGIQQKFNQFQIAARSNGRKLVCAHIRVRSNPTIPDDYRPPVQLNVSVIWNFFRHYNNSALYRIFVASDSEGVRQEAKRLFPGVVQDVEGNIVHVDRYRFSQDYACAGLEKVILDQQTLSTCDVLFMTDSGLGRIAAMLRGTDDELYCMDNNTRYKHCSFSDKDFFPYNW